VFLTARTEKELAATAAEISGQGGHAAYAAADLAELFPARGDDMGALCVQGRSAAAYAACPPWPEISAAVARVPSPFAR